MKWSSYSAYKPSGVEWLGNVPEHWEVSPIKFLVSTPVTDGPHETPGFFDEGIPFVSAEAINGGQINFSRIRGHISEEDHRRFSKKYRPKFGDIYIVKSGATTGRIAMVETNIEFNIWSPLAAIRCNPNLMDRHFLYFYLQSKEFQTAIELSWSFGTQQNIGMGVIQNLAVPVSSVKEQTAIADFLDRETGKIDTLVAKNRTLIERLKEKRTVLISSVVTGKVRVERRKTERQYGTQPDESGTLATDSSFIIHHSSFKTKPSGVDWLGEVPVEWDMPPLYVRYAIDLGKMLHEGRISGKYLVPYLRNVDVQWDRIESTDLPEMDIGPWELDRYTVKRDDLLVCEGGEVGRAAIVADVEEGLGYQKALHRLRPLTPNEFPRFMFYSLHWAGHQGIFLAEGNPNTIAHLTGEKLRRYRFPRPPLPEQTAIADFLDRETANIDKLVARVETAIERLREYRTALITAAVTGKIDLKDN